MIYILVLLLHHAVPAGSTRLLALGSRYRVPAHDTADVHDGAGSSEAEPATVRRPAHGRGSGAGLCRYGLAEPTQSVDPVLPADRAADDDQQVDGVGPAGAPPGRQYHDVQRRRRAAPGAPVVRRAHLQAITARIQVGERDEMVA